MQRPLPTERSPPIVRGTARTWQQEVLDDLHALLTTCTRQLGTRRHFVVCLIEMSLWATVAAGNSLSLLGRCQKAHGLVHFGSTKQRGRILGKDLRLTLPVSRVDAVTR